MNRASTTAADPLAVLGMHRSGTSFLIRALNLSGLWLGNESDLYTVEGRAAIGNPKGNYEHREGIAINNAILARSGGAWFSPPPKLLGDETDAIRIGQFCAGLERGCPAHCPRWGWKDPRTLLTFEVWQRVLQRRVFVVASFRHPTAVARSLLARDKIPMELGYALWRHYNALLLHHVERLPHALLRFDVDKKELAARVVGVCKLAGLRTDQRSIEDWHDAGLVRNKADAEDLTAAPEIASLWAELNARYRRQAEA